LQPLPTATSPAVLIASATERHTVIRAIVTDIEGTTSSLSFVKDVLFPYAAEHLRDYVMEHRTETAVRNQLNATAELAGLPSHDVKPLIRQLSDWIASDTKATPLKALQGMIWEGGYRSGAYKAHLYDDAIRGLHDWHEKGLSLYVYSSGSIHAQQLFFEFSRYGDVRALFRDYFDTTTGNKHDAGSYEAIARAITEPPGEILFLSDIEAELDAASGAGYKTCRLARPEDYGDAATNIASGHPVFQSFDDIALEDFS